jgi:hypothetical protein
MVERMTTKKKMAVEWVRQTAQIGDSATHIERPYSTVMVRCLKLAGFLHSMRNGNVRRFRIVNSE